MLDIDAEEEQRLMQAIDDTVVLMILKMKIELSKQLQDYISRPRKPEVINDGA